MGIETLLAGAAPEVAAEAAALLLDQARPPPPPYCCPYPCPYCTLTPSLPSRRLPPTTRRPPPSRSPRLRARAARAVRRSRWLAWRMRRALRGLSRRRGSILRAGRSSKLTTVEPLPFPRRTLRHPGRCLARAPPHARARGSGGGARGGGGGRGKRLDARGRRPRRGGARPPPPTVLPTVPPTVASPTAPKTRRRAPAVRTQKQTQKQKHLRRKRTCCARALRGARARAAALTSARPPQVSRAALAQLLDEAVASGARPIACPRLQ